ncbi:MAG: transposase, partial [Bacteroidales bacterium]|nr:transposase [Bacteroidales bacterium]
MFIRKKKNRSGTTSVVVVEKKGGSFRELKTIGVSSDENEIKILCYQGKKWISTYCGERDMFVVAEKEREEKQVT